MNELENGGLKRALKVRHVNMIAIGGAIGTGLFVAVGGSLHEAGPGGAMLAYGVIGIMVFFLMTSLGEMSTYMPVTGSFQTYATKFVDPALGFALGWNYWYNWAITVAAELEAGVIVISFWLPDMSHGQEILWSALFLALLFILNYFSVGAYGESEFWFAGVKVLTIIVFLVVGILMIFGIMGGTSPGFSNWTLEDAPFPGGFTAILSIFMIAGFSFQGTELIGVAAGEVEHPEKSIPRAIKTVFLRIILFYIGAILVIGFLLPYNDPNLLHTGVENVSVSPFTLIFHRAGIAAAASVMNAVILTSVLSCGNSGMYASTRMLYSLAMEGKAPAIFKKVNKRGVPVFALILTTIIGMAAFLGSLAGSGAVYVWLVNASGVAGFIAWLGIAISHYKFRKAFVAQGHSLNELKYKAMLFPFGPCLAMILCIIVILGQFYANADFSFLGFIVAYIGAALFLVIYLIYKIVKKTKFIKPEDADLSQGFAVTQR
ncbi:MAG: amino acid permease [Clostridiales Family XIII bacterium]|jgi:lysine-specific permease|nr:amino acid permease [Clostridiales Family XIII bacterium]